jgi:hypothetical protein
MILVGEWPRGGLLEVQDYVRKLRKWCIRFVKKVKQGRWELTVKGYVIFMQVVQLTNCIIYIN